MKTATQIRTPDSQPAQQEQTESVEPTVRADLAKPASDELSDKEKLANAKADYLRGMGSCRKMSVRHGLTFKQVALVCAKENWPKLRKQQYYELEQKVLHSSQPKLIKTSVKPVCGMNEHEYYDKLEKWSRFDVSLLYETTPEGEVRLRKDWLTIAKEHRALELLETTSTTTESGMIVQRVRVKSKDALRSLELIGRLRGWDKTHMPPSFQMNVTGPVQVVWPACFDIERPPEIAAKPDPAPLPVVEEGAKWIENLDDN